MCVRTNVAIDDDLLLEAMQYSSARTKKFLIDEALHTFIAVKASEKKIGAEVEEIYSRYKRRGCMVPTRSVFKYHT